MEERIVIVAYKPFPGKEKDLEELMRNHYKILKEQQLVTDRLPVMMKAKDGTLVEIFEWRSVAAMESAHSNALVTALWKEYSIVCSYIPIAQLEEAGKLFTSFEAFE